MLLPKGWKLTVSLLVSITVISLVGQLYGRLQRRRHGRRWYQFEKCAAVADVCFSLTVVQLIPIVPADRNVQLIGSVERRALSSLKSFGVLERS